MTDIGGFDRLHRPDEEFEHLRGDLTETFSRYSEDEVDALVDEAAKSRQGEFDARFDMVSSREQLEESRLLT